MTMNAASQMFANVIIYQATLLQHMRFVCATSTDAAA